MPPKIKICGITNLADARASAKLGADYLGLNFYEKSPRYITPKEATAISTEIKKDFPNIKIVGVFVNAQLDTIEHIISVAKLDIAQIHGDENNLPKISIPVWHVIRVRRDQKLPDIESIVAGATGTLIDTYVESAYGGTGILADWSIVNEIRNQIPFLILAGGLTPANIPMAIKKIAPDVVDTASGVEMDGNPRRKDWKKIQAFIEAVQKTNF